MHILFFSTMNGSPWGGSEELWYKTAKLAIAEGHQVSVIYKYWGSNESTKIKKLRTLGARIIYRDKTNTFPRELKWYTKLRHRFKMHLGLKLPHKPSKEVQYAYASLLPANIDTVCFSQGATFDLALANDYQDLLTLLNCPYIIISQFNRDFAFSLTARQRLRAKQIIKNAKCMYFVSKRNHEYAEHQLASKIDSFKVISNSLNITDTSMVNYPNNLPCTTFCSVGRLDVKTKGVDLLIKCFANDVWKHRQWQYLIYGDGPDKEYFQDLIRFYQLEDKVKLCGFAKDIRAVWAKAHILLQPSVAEGTPLTLQEAMFCGRPALVTNIAGNSELIQEGYNGYVAEGPVYNTLSNSLERAYQDRANWCEKGFKAFETVQAKVNLHPERELLKNLL